LVIEGEDGETLAIFSGWQNKIASEFLFIRWEKVKTLLTIVTVLTLDSPAVVVPKSSHW